MKALSMRALVRRCLRDGRSSRAAAASAGVFAAPAGAVSAHAAASSTLTMESSRNRQWLTTSTVHYHGHHQHRAPTLIYESCCSSTSPSRRRPYDFLATKFKWNPGGTSITFTIRKNVKFSNGKTMTRKMSRSHTTWSAQQGRNGGGLDLATPAAKVKATRDRLLHGVRLHGASVHRHRADREQSIWSHVGDPGKHVDTTRSHRSVRAEVRERHRGYRLVATRSTGRPVAKKAGPPAVKEVQFPTFASTSTCFRRSRTTRSTGRKLHFRPQRVHERAGHAVWFAGVNTTRSSRTCVRGR